MISELSRMGFLAFLCTTRNGTGAKRRTGRYEALAMSNVYGEVRSHLVWLTPLHIRHAQTALDHRGFAWATGPVQYLPCATARTHADELND